MKYNSIKSIKKVAVLCLLATGLIAGCNKDEATMPESNSENTGYGKILYFENEAELDSTLQKAASMSATERADWEKSQNFKSYHTLSSEHYQNLDIESFQNIEDLKKLAGESQYLQMVERDEELYLECELYENNKRFVANADRLYQVGSTVYKVFENDVAFTPVENIELLKQAGSLENLDPLIQVKERKNTISRLASIVYPCDVWDSSNKSVGKDRTYMKISLDYVNKLDFTIPQIWLSWEIRPYKKTLGVWFWCTRTCHIEWDVTVCADDGSYYTLAGYKSLNTSYFIDVDKVERPNSPFSTFSLISCDVKGWSNSTWTDKCHLTWLSRK